MSEKIPQTYDQEYNLKTQDYGFAGIKRGPIRHFKGKELTVFLIFLVNCNHSNNDNFYFDGKTFPLKRGEWVTSVSTITKLTGLKTSSVRTAIKNLQRLTNLEKKSLANRATLLSLGNIDSYLVSAKDLANKSTKKEAKKRQSTDSQSTTNNKEKNENNDSENEKIIPSDFHFIISREIADHNLSVRRISTSDADIRKYAKDIYLLEKQDLKIRESAIEDIQRVMEAVKQHDGEKFFPLIRNAKSFRKSFIHIEDFLHRKRSKKSYKNYSRAIEGFDVI